MTASHALLKQIHRNIECDADYFVKLLLDPSRSSQSNLLSGLVEDENKILISMKVDNQQGKILKKLLVNYARGVVFGILCIIDGVSYPEVAGIPDLSLIDRTTGKNLTDQFLHDEFYEVTE